MVLLFEKLQKDVVSLPFSHESSNKYNSVNVNSFLCDKLFGFICFRRYNNLFANIMNN